MTMDKVYEARAEAEDWRNRAIAYTGEAWASSRLPWEHFALDEFKCKCCKRMNVAPELLARLNELRERLGSPVVVVSGTRCKERNERVGGATNSYHLSGLAADVRPAKGGSMGRLRALAEVVFEDGGLGVYGDFIHVDVRGCRARWGK